jgi:uncharacterized protein (DUF4213/DUF364 family)
MEVLSEIRKALKPGKILSIQVGYSRTAVLIETDTGLSCGLAATLANPEFEHRCRPSVFKAGHLLEMSISDLAGLTESDSFTEVSIGLATINAMVAPDPEEVPVQSVEDFVYQHGSGKNIAIVGHFPFVDNVRLGAKNVWVLELCPQEGDLPASAAPEVIPQADIVVITATTLINHTFKGLIDLCKSEARVMLAGPSTPLSPVLFRYGVDALGGSIVLDPHRAMLGISQGSSSHQLQKEGILKKVCLQKNGSPD